MIIYQPVLFAQTDDGRTFLEVNRDAYKRNQSGLDYVRGLAKTFGVDSAVDWNRAQQVVSGEEGIARDVTLVPNSLIEKVKNAVKELTK